MRLLEFFYSLNAAISRNLRAGRLCAIKGAQRAAHNWTARKLSSCMALLDAFSLYLLPILLNYGRSKRPVLYFNIPRYLNETNHRRILDSMGRTHLLKPWNDNA